MFTKNKTHRHSLGKGFLSRSFQNESGVALVVALLLMAVMIALVPAALQLTTGEIDRTATFKDDRELFYLAEAGLEHGKSLVKDTDLNTLLAGPDGDKSTLTDNGTVAGVGDTADATPFTWNGIPYDDVTLGTQGTYYIRVYDNDDGDNDPATDSDDLVYIDSVGVNAEGARKLLSALVHRFTPLPSTLPAAVTLTGPTSIISASGNDFNVYGGTGVGGDGYGIDGLPDATCTGQYAVTTEAIGALQQVGDNNEAACTAAACMAANPVAYDNFVGTDGGVPSVGTSQTEFTGVEAEALRDQLVNAPSVPDLSFSGYTIAGPIDGPWGTQANPIIVHFDDAATINGSIHGYGVLIVDGDLDISGTLIWDGIIIIGACSTCTCPTCPGTLVGTGSATVHGAVVVGNAINATANFTGSADIFYSCEGIAIANSVIEPVFSVVAWNEVD